MVSNSWSWVTRMEALSEHGPLEKGQTVNKFCRERSLTSPPLATGKTDVAGRADGANLLRLVRFLVSELSTALLTFWTLLCTGKGSEKKNREKRRRRVYSSKPEDIIVKIY